MSLFSRFRRGFRLRLGLARTGEGVRTGATAEGAVVVSASPTTTPITAATITVTATTTLTPSARCLVALLFDQLIQLPVLEHLAECSQGEAENGHGGPQVERFLQRPGRAHFVVAQADAEAATFAIAATTATTAAATPAFSAGPITLGSLLLGFTVGITHGPWPGIRRKCAASSVCCPRPSAADDLSGLLDGAVPASGWWRSRR